VHSHDPVPPQDVEPIPPDKNALELLREGRNGKPKVDSPIVLSGNVWSYLRLEDMAPDVALGDRTPLSGDVRLWPIDQRDAAFKRGVMVGSIHDGKKWRTLNLKGGVSEVVNTTYLAQEEVLALFRRIAQSIKRQVAKGENRMAWFGGCCYFVLSKRLFAEFQAEEVVTTVPDSLREVAPETAPNLTQMLQGALALATTSTNAPAETEQGSGNASLQEDASPGHQTELFGPLPKGPVQEKPKQQRKRRTTGNNSAKPPQLPGLEDEK
jgi:hypothetical protein